MGDRKLNISGAGATALTQLTHIVFVLCVATASSTLFVLPRLRLLFFLLFRVAEHSQVTDCVCVPRPTKLSGDVSDQCLHQHRNTRQL